MHKIKSVSVHEIINKVCKYVTVNSKENRFFLDDAVEHRLQRVTLCQPHLKISRQGMRHPVHLLTSTVPLWVWKSINMWFGFLVHFQPFQTMVRLGLIFLHRSVYHRSCSKPNELLQQALSFQLLEVRRQTLCISETQKCLWGLSLVSLKCDDLHFSFI